MRVGVRTGAEPARQCLRRCGLSRLLAQGHAVEMVQLLLGHAELDHVAAYLEVSTHDLDQACAGIDAIFPD